VQSAEYEAAFERLFTVARVTAYRITRDREEAEDLAIETMTRALLRWDVLEEPREPWITTVAMRLALDFLRRQRRQEWLLRVLPFASSSPSSSSTDHLHLLDAVRSLPRRQRDVTVARYLLDLSEHDTAVLLGCTPGAVKQHLSRARAALRPVARAAEAP
jgi:RNA polymerase sigma factor (sigma-70 family)